MGSETYSFMNLLNKKRTVQNTQGETCAELYERLNEGYGLSLRNFQERFNGKNEVRFSMKRIASKEEVVIMEKMYPRIEDKKSAKAEGIMKAGNQPEANALAVGTVKKVVRPVDIPRILALVISGLIVAGHGALIWYDCSLLWGQPGFIAGVVVFLMIVFGMLAMATKNMKPVVENVVWVVWMLEGCAIFVHFPSFTANASEAYARGLGELHTWLLSAIICVCSIAATYFYKETILLSVEKPKK